MKKNILAYITPTYHQATLSAQQTKQHTSNIRAVYYFPLRQKKKFDKVTRIIIHCEECNTYRQNYFDFFKYKTIVKKTLAQSFVTS